MYRINFKINFMCQKLLFLLLLFFAIISCKRNYPAPLEFFFNELENRIAQKEVQNFKEENIANVIDLNLFSDKIEVLYYDSAYNKKLLEFFENIGHKEIIETKEPPTPFLRFLFHEKLNNKRFNFEKMKEEYIRIVDQNAKGYAKRRSDAQFLLEETVRKNLKNLKLGDTLRFIFPIRDESIYSPEHCIDCPPPDDTLKLTGILVNQGDDSRSKYYVKPFYSFKIKRLSGDYLINGEKYIVGDTIKISWKLVYAGQ